MLYSVMGCVVYWLAVVEDDLQQTDNYLIWYTIRQEPDFTG